MGASQPEPQTEMFVAIDPILGYLNYGNGSFDAGFFKNLNVVFGLLGADDAGRKPPNKAAASESATSDQTSTDDAAELADRESVSPTEDAHPLDGCTAFAFRQQLVQRLGVLEKDNSAFKDSWQSRFAIEVTFDVLLPKYHLTEFVFSWPNVRVGAARNSNARTGFCGIVCGRRQSDVYARGVAAAK